MLRKIVEINEEKCTGCGICITACAEGALKLIDGKARLISDVYCDGLGACLPACPADAINIIERNAAAFDEEAVKKLIEAKDAQPEPLACGCPGNSVKVMEQSEHECSCHTGVAVKSQLGQWPVQMKLVPVNAPYLDNAELLIAADCTAYAYANFHQEFMKNRVTIIGCPKLDNVDYSEKLSEMFRLNEIKNITVVRMAVPCCSGLANAVKNAVLSSGKNIAVDVIILDTSGQIISDKNI